MCGASLAHLPAVELNAADVKRTLEGIDMRPNDAELSRWTNAQPVRMHDSTGELIAVGVYDESRSFIHPKVVIWKE